MAEHITADGKTTVVKPAKGKYFTLKELQFYCGGFVEAITLPDGRTLYMHEDGKMMGAKPNPLATLLLAGVGTARDDHVVGDVLVCDPSEID